jgi:drug/metabolite transporter (DMT)-like permease
MLEIGRRLRAMPPEWVLVLTTIVWGPTYWVMQRALSLAGPMFLVGSRFAVAALALSFLCRQSPGGLTWREARAGALIGTSVMFSYAFLALGLLHIPSSEAAILSALYVPMVPLLQWLFLRRGPGLLAWAGILLALTGLAIISDPRSTSFGFGIGEFLMILCAIATAGEVILISAFATGGDARRVTTVQLAVASLLAFAAMTPMGEARPSASWWLAGTALGLGLSSAAIQLAMNWAQKTVSATRATLIYTAEPVWAALIGRVAGERLPAMTFAGAVFILVGILVGELDFHRPRRPATSRNA